MQRKHYISLFLILILSIITIHIAEADTHSELSNIFTLDTREEGWGLSHSASSNIFTLDTREYPPQFGMTHSALSNIFTLDTREEEWISSHSALSNIFTLNTTDYPDWDVNKDGIVDISDLVLVGVHFGESGGVIGDVNSDNTVDISDLVLVGIHFGESTIEVPAAPIIGLNGYQIGLKAQSNDELLVIQLSVDKTIDIYGIQFDLSYDPQILEAISVTEGPLLKSGGATYWHKPHIDNQSGRILNAAATRLAATSGINKNGSLVTVTFRITDTQRLYQGKLALNNLKIADSKGKLIIAIDKGEPFYLEQLIIPQRAQLAQNYPNPFNPETWIPYQLAGDADVVIKIYNAAGRMVRKLEVGRKTSGFYMGKERAAHWDGKNDAGERVSSGVYFYTINAGDFTATNKMVIVK